MSDLNEVRNKKFLDSCTPLFKDRILMSIAGEYGISMDAALREVTEEGAELLLEYLKGELRTLVHAKMKQMKLVFF